MSPRENDHSLKYQFENSIRKKLEIIKNKPLSGLFLFLTHRMSHGKPYSLGKSERLKSRKQIDGLFESGKKVTQFPFRLLYKTESGKSGINAGFTVSSKNFPRAVDRNRIKRLIRESYRVQKKDLEISLARNSIRIELFFIYTGKEIVTHKETTLRIKQMLDKLLKNLDEDRSANI